MEFLGIIGGLCFAFCGVPAAYQTFKNKKTLGTPVSISGAIVSGALLMFVYLYFKYGFNPVIAFNTIIEATSWSIILYYGVKNEEV